MLLCYSENQPSIPIGPETPSKGLSFWVSLPLLSTLLQFSTNGINFPSGEALLVGAGRIQHTQDRKQHPSKAPFSSSSLTLTHPQSLEALCAYSTGRGAFLAPRDGPGPGGEQSELYFGAPHRKSHTVFGCQERLGRFPVDVFFPP